MLGLIPPGSTGETNLNNLANILSTALKSAERTLRAFAAAEFDCCKLRGLKQAGGFLTGDPLASSPYPKAFRVSTSEEFQPSRCGAQKLARLKLRINRASSYFVHLRTGNQKYYCNIFVIARIFFGTHKLFSQSPRMPLFPAEIAFCLRKEPSIALYNTDSFGGNIRNDRRTRPPTTNSPGRHGPSAMTAKSALRM